MSFLKWCKWLILGTSVNKDIYELSVISKIYFKDKFFFTAEILKEECRDQKASFSPFKDEHGTLISIIIIPCNYVL